MVGPVESVSPMSLAYPENHQPRSSRLRDAMFFLCLGFITLLSIVSFSDVLIHGTTSLSATPSRTTISRVQSVDTNLAFTVPFHTTAIACPPANLTDITIRKMLKAQSGEDVQLLTWFNGLCQGSYFEMGALWYHL